MCSAISSRPRLDDLKKERVSACSTGPRLLIADDHAMFAEALRVCLEKTFTVVGSYG
jgi:hypothetical protein